MLECLVVSLCRNKTALEENSCSDIVPQREKNVHVNSMSWPNLCAHLGIWTLKPTGLMVQTHRPEHIVNKFMCNVLSLCAAKTSGSPTQVYCATVVCLISKVQGPVA